MPVKSRVKSKAKPRVKPVVKKRTVKAEAIRKAASKPVRKAKVAVGKTKPAERAVSASGRKKSALSASPVEVTRTVNLTNQIRRPTKAVSRKSAVRMGSTNTVLFNFMKAPRVEYAFDVGDPVEVFCDHEKGRERVRGWTKGIVVQVDNKMVAVQFRSNVFLTDGWMVPDRILWYPLTSEHIHPVATGRKSAVKKEAIPDY